MAAQHGLVVAGLAAAAGAGAPGGAAQADAPARMALPEVPLEALLQGVPGAVSEARRALAELGALAVRGVASEGGAPLGTSADAALRAWAACLSAGGAARSGALVRTLAGGRARRVSVTAGGRWDAPPQRPGPPCAAAAAATREMRAGLRRATRALAAALEPASGPPPAGGAPPGGGWSASLALREAVERGAHLEHLHLYEEAAAAGGALDEPALELHTDAGLLLAFVAPLMAAGSPAGAAGAVEVLLPSGQRRALVAPRDGVVFLAGEASRLLRWPEPAAAWRPAPHALRLGAGFGWRAWFGAMLLPPPDTLVPGSPTAGARAPAVAFGALWEAARLEQGPGPGAGAVGCGGGLRLADQAGGCPAGSASCWLTCMSTLGLETCQGHVWTRAREAGSRARRANLSVQCREPSSGRRWPSETGAMCRTCRPMCTAAVEGHAPGPPAAPAAGRFCRSLGGSVSGTGSGTTMYMDGLRLTSAARDEVCVAFLVPGLVLDRPWKLALACGGALALSACVELTSLCRQRLPAARRNDAGLACHVASLVLVYSAMLLVMTYSLELFGSVVLGLALGRGVGWHASRRGPARGAAAGATPRSVVEGVASFSALTQMETHLEVTLDVEGMVCPACVAKVTKALVAMEGVVSADVSLELHEAEVVYQPFVLSRDLCDAVRGAGYAADVQAGQSVSRAPSSPAAARSAAPGPG